MNKLLYRLAPAVVLCLPPLAWGQATAADPAQSKSPAPALRYPSAFADYKPWQDIKPGNWRGLNDKLALPSAQAGGHAGHGMAAPSVPPAPAEGASAPAAPAHQGHHMHGGKP